MAVSVLVLTVAMMLGMAGHGGGESDNARDYSTFEYAGVTHHYSYYEPTFLPANAPLLFVLHSYGGGAVYMDHVADAHAFAVVYPQASEDSQGKASWDMDDVGFLSALARDLQAEYDLNPDRTFVAGTSQGGFMGHVLAMDAPDVFRGVASFAGTMAAGIWDTRDTVTPYPLLQVQGLDDEIVPLEGLPDENPRPSHGRCCAPHMHTIIDYWSERSRCLNQSRRNLNVNTTLTRHLDCIGGNEIWYYEVDGFGHDFPTLHNSAGFDGAEVIWEFFSRFPNLSVEPHPLDLPLRAIHASGNWAANRDVVDNWNDRDRHGPLVPLDHVEYLRSLHVNWVGLSVALHYDDSMDSTVERVYTEDVRTSTFTDDALRQIIRELREAGFGVYLTLAFEAHEAEGAARPVRRWQLGDPGHVDTGIPLDDPDAFGRILPKDWPWRPDHPDHQRFVAEFWRTYTDQVVHFARIAEEEGARLYSLGTETDRLFRTRSGGGHWPNHFRQELETMVRRVRAVYSGALTYDMHFSALTAPDFFGPGSDHLWQNLDLDMVGVSAWFPLVSVTPSRVTSRDVLQGHWERIFREYLIPLADRNPDLPVVFLEHGGTDHIKTPLNPAGDDETLGPFRFSDVDGNGLDDGRETHANMFGALLDTMDTYPGVLNGVFWWDNWLASDAEWSKILGWRGFGIRGKLAEDVVREAYAAWR